MTDEFFAAHMCGCGHALISDSPKKTDPAAARSVSRRQVIGAAGVLTAAALLAACGSRDGSDQGAGTSEAPAPSVNPSVSPAELGNVMNGIDEVQVWQEEFYKDLHRHPDVWGEEARTAGKVTDKLQEVGVEEILQIGGGVVGVIRNGEGRSVLFRADMDALPVTEATGLEYASTEPGKMHACGHDAHVASALGAAALLAKNRNAWSGTYLALFQPGEETGKGAQAMVDDGLVDKLADVKPDVCLGQHVLTAPQAGHVATRTGPVLSAGDSLKVTVFGQGSHGSMPHLGVDPAVLASAIVMRLQGIVSREIAPGDFGVVTVGSVRIGDSPNVIADRAELLLNVRTYDPAVRDTILGSIDRIVRAECEASGSPKEPTFETIATFPRTVNDPQVTDAVTQAFTQAFGPDRVHELEPATASEDFSRIPDAFGVPYTYWSNGGFLPGQHVVANHNPEFAPAIQPTLRTGTEAAIAATLAYLG
ncbi:amidohydrolase [Mycolicibacterium novocastrense]|uniref:Amidohydrolase n=3 Tax=Mycolicibacterium novocastrense TaxID=59813 RepID=A0ABQ0KSR2_MYCNV|nr:amidohydrolase [Mycolicibacterium novocastrense]